MRKTNETAAQSTQPHPLRTQASQKCGYWRCPACNGFALRFPIGRLGPELVAIRPQRVEIDRAGFHGPPTAIACQITQIFIVIRRADENALPRSIFTTTPISRPRPIYSSRREGFYATSVRPRQAFKFAKFVNPDSLYRFHLRLRVERQNIVVRVILGARQN